MARKIVINSSPLIVLQKSGYLSLLGQLFGQVVLPEEVLLEVGFKPDGATVLSGQGLASWEELNCELGRGESAVIALMLDGAGDLAVIDDLKGRRIAERKGVPVIGTLGLIVIAKEQGLIPSVAEGVGKLVEAGLYLDPALKNRILAVSGE